MQKDLPYGRDGGRMKKKLTNNLLLKILSVIFAFILWLVVVNINDPDVTRTIYGIPISILNEDKIINQGIGQVYKVDYPANSQAVVVVKGARSLVETLKPEDIKATVDFSDISSVGAVTINITVPDGISLISKKTESMRISIEPLKIATYSINFLTVGTPAEGYLLGDTEISPNVVKIKGPESIIAQISDVMVEEDIDGISTDISKDSNIILLDSNGKEINYQNNPNITFSVSSVKVYAEILKGQDIPIHFTVTGNVPDGYRYIGVDASRASVRLKGTRESMTSVSSITIPEEEGILDLSGLTGTTEITINLEKYLPNGISFVNDADKYMRVTLIIEPLYTKDIEINLDAIKVLNSPENFNVVYDRTTPIIVQVKGLQADLDKLTASMLNPQIDLSEYGIGEYNCPVKLTLPEDISLIHTASVKVTITAKEAETSSVTETSSSLETASETETSSQESSAVDVQQTTAIPANAKPSNEETSSEAPQNTTEELISETNSETTTVQETESMP